MERVVGILCRRDGCTREEAVTRINETVRLMSECNYNPIECEDIMLEELGLEMDYIFDIL